MKSVKMKTTVLMMSIAALGTQLLRAELATEGSEVSINRNFARKPIPRWSGTYLLGYELYPQSAPLVYAYDKSGAKLFETALAIEGVQESFLRSTAASRDGKLAYLGTAVSVTGARVGFIAFLNLAGRLTNVVRLEKFYPQHACFTVDGTLWVAGTVGSDRNGSEENHDILRAYTSEGKLKLSALPRASFAATSLDKVQSPHPAVDGRTLSALASNDKVVVFLAAAFKEVVSIALDGKVLVRTATELPSYDFITGFAVGQDGRALISSEKHAPTPEFAFDRFDPLSGNWNRIYSRAARERDMPRAIGLVDGEQMLVKIEEGRFRWVKRLP